mmetsp:Transcript_31178/g.47716  ORF Transcript_31178/g.47716 Transcript_31178/m.47716 type:complete len:349 (+) Transcript_31178:2470-3516(+)
MDLQQRHVDEAEGVQGFIGLLVDQFELDVQHVFLQLCLLVVGNGLVVLHRHLLGLLLVQDVVLQVCLGEGSVHLVDLSDLYEFRDNSMLGQHRLPVEAHLFFLHLLRRSHLVKLLFVMSHHLLILVQLLLLLNGLYHLVVGHFLLLDVSPADQVVLLIHLELALFLQLLFFVHRRLLLEVKLWVLHRIQILILTRHRVFSLWVRLLMNERESDVVLELGDGEIELIVILQLGVHLQLVQKTQSKRSNDRLLVIIGDILEELVDELNFEVRQIEASVIVAIELVGHVEEDLVLLGFLPGVDELVDQAVANLLHLVVAGDQMIEFERDLVADVQVSDGLLLFRDQQALLV